MSTIPSLVPYIKGVHVSAFRLETRARYALTYEATMFDDFIHGRPIPDPSEADWFRPWLNMIKASPASWERVRIVDEPVTDYQRFAEWCAHWNREAGEIIHRLPTGAVNDVTLFGDWWMFDDAAVVRLVFDEQSDDLHHYELVPGEEINIYRRLRDRVLEAATAYELKRAG